MFSHFQEDGGGAGPRPEIVVQRPVVIVDPTMIKVAELKTQFNELKEMVALMLKK